ncbi:ThiF family adenylyltransferase (plasmid) [Macrococcus psychrotolerans]|uniref:ThiF family adenylyltransferase n=1 Tax=Macrococcus psychrotolerans TaxID=3039389 RepID=A0AAT9P9L4_9STAP|nr:MULTISPECIES: ThiF family adenylyltransferase [Macrococcus]QYA34106.1 ThiF family adenylyltransferase [Macrococcus sp. 19Msa1099]QYA38890.1 ThiF family adenylyltransferase [Macrococcus caseolyticus]QYA77613.1 ThiF family adenylyltransferase [Macrococcus caseolyticus]
MHDKIHELYSYFLKLGYIVKIEDDKISWNINIKNNNFKLSIVIPEYYPFEFLKIKIINFSDFDFYIPHTLTGNYLCLYEVNSDRHNYKNYLEEAKETLQRAVDILEKSVEREVENQYKYEFSDIYPFLTSNQVNYFLSEDYKTPKLLKSLEGFKDKDNKEKLRILYDTNYSIDSLGMLVSNLGIKDYKIKESVLYIPVENSNLSSPITKFADLINVLENNKHFNFFAEKLIKGLSTITLGVYQEGINIPTILCFKIEKLYFPKGKIVKKSSYKSILKINNSKLLVNMKINDLSQNKLIFRSGDGHSNRKLSFYIIGCGSLGSFLSKSICDTFDIENIILQDNDILEVDNIGRHLCGLRSLNKFKSNEVAKVINNYYPHINTKAIYTNILNEFLGKEKHLLSEKYDFLICVVGDENVEEQLIQMYEKKKLHTPLIIVWIEPYLVAGHILIFNGELNELSKSYIFDKERNIKLSVVQNVHQYSKSEAGCQSRFMPYSGFEVQLFINKCVDLLMNNRYLEKKGNYHITYFGNMKEARGKNIEIKQQWTAKNNRELFVTRFDE